MAELSCGGSCMKYILFLFNIIFFICGAAILTIGIWAKVDGSLGHYMTIINFDVGNPYFDQAVYLMIAVGSFIFLVGFLGCCGACCESSCMLALYSTFVILIILAQVAAMVLAFVFLDNLGSDLEQQMALQAKNDVSNDPYENGITQAWNAMQYELLCCGGYNYADYVSSKFRNESQAAGENFKVPLSCCWGSDDASYNVCNQEASTIPGNDTTFTELFDQGCYDSMVNWIEDHAWIIIGSALGIALFEILIVVFACCVRSEISDPETYK